MSSNIEFNISRNEPRFYLTFEVPNVTTHFICNTHFSFSEFLINVEQSHFGSRETG